MKHLIFITLFLASTINVFAQKYLTRTGKVTFFSETSIENIEAFNNEVACILNSESGEYIFQVPIKSFKFDRSLMQEHFNENYMESDKFPKAEYRGTVDDISKVNFSKDGTYDVTSKGKMKIHGVTKTVNIPAKVIVKGKSITIDALFNVSPADYNIEIPGVVKDKIAKNIEVTVNSILQRK